MGPVTSSTETVTVTTGTRSDWARNRGSPVPDIVEITKGTGFHRYNLRVTGRVEDWVIEMGLGAVAILHYQICKEIMGRFLRISIRVGGIRIIITIVVGKVIGNIGVDRTGGRSPLKIKAL